MMRSVEAEDAAALERRLDAHFEKLCFPWAKPLEGYLASLLAYEVTTYNAMRRSIHAYGASVDLDKYALQRCVAARPRVPFASALPTLRTVARPDWDRAFQALQAGREYADIWVVFTQYRRGDLELHHDSGHRYEFRPRSERQLVFDALDRRLYGSLDGPAPEPAPILEAITRASKRLAGWRHRVGLDKGSRDELMRLQGQQPSSYSLPPEWTYGDVSITECRRVWDALALLVQAHLFGVPDPSQRRRWDLLMIWSYGAFVGQVADLSGVERGHVDSVLGAMTFDEADPNCDPGVECLLRVNHHIVVGPFLTLSSRMERNFYAGILRRSPQVIHEQSHLLSRAMATQLATILRELGYLCEPEVAIEGTNVDLVVYCPKESFLLTLELKWMYNAGDARDLRNRDQDALKALNKQLPKHRRALASTDGVESLCKRAFGKPVKVDGSASMLVMRGYVGSHALPRDFGWVEETIFLDLVKRLGLKAVVENVGNETYVQERVPDVRQAFSEIKLSDGTLLRVPAITMDIRV